MLPSPSSLLPGVLTDEPKSVTVTSFQVVSSTRVPPQTIKYEPSYLRISRCVRLGSHLPIDSGAVSIPDKAPHRMTAQNDEDHRWPLRRPRRSILRRQAL